MFQCNRHLLADDTNYVTTYSNKKNYNDHINQMCRFKLKYISCLNLRILLNHVAALAFNSFPLVYCLLSIYHFHIIHSVHCELNYKFY